ncbi:MAG: hypothetical protein ACTSU8_03265 [Alphaproteobacteria bacterium]
MLRFECDNPELTKALARLGTDVSKAGAYFSENLVLKAMDGDFSFTSTVPGSEPELLMSIPEKAFIPYDGVEFKLNGNDLVIASGAEKLPSDVRERLETMVLIYNLTKKIEKYKESSPRVAFKDDPEMLERLTAARAGTRIAENVLEILNAKDQEKIIISSFLKTRNFDFGESKKKIIPFIDFTNHNTLAMPFNRKKTEKGDFVMSLRNSKPITEDNQCFARYGKWDACDTYLMFGFSSDTSAFVRSIPMEIPIEGVGVLKVNSKIGGQFGGTLPPEMEDLQKLFPQLLSVTKEGIEVSTLRIPNPRRPVSLKRILASLITQMAPDLGLEELESHVTSTEFQVVYGTLQFYTSLLEFFEEKKEKYQSNPAFREAVKMAKIQIHEIEEYQEISRKIGKNFGSGAGVA